MADTMHVPFERKVAKEHHLLQDSNAFGTHDRFYFTPATDGRVRCFKCNRLMDNNMMDVGKCPQCLFQFSKAQARDMYIESVYHKVNHQGWSDEIIQLLSKTTEPSMVRPDMRVQPLNDAARKVVEFYVSKMRQYEREDSQGGEVYKMRTNALNADLAKNYVPRRLDV